MPKPTQTVQQKAMSDRLLTMKFMQRATAKPGQKQPNPSPLPPPTPTSRAGANDDTETCWRLSYVATPPASRLDVVVGVGAGDLDSSDSESEDPGRLMFGEWKKKSEEATTKDESSDSEDSSSEEEEEETPKRRKRRSSPTLRGLTSISNAGPGGQGAVAGGKCHKCGETGHMIAKCPKNACYNCGENGHRSAECDEPNKKRRKEDRFRRQQHLLAYDVASREG